MARTCPDFDAVLDILHAQGSRHVTREVLEANATLVDDFQQDDAYFPTLAMDNGVLWFFDKNRRPATASGQSMKAKAPKGARGLLGDLEGKGAMVLVEGERDWLVALSLGLRAICVGGAKNLTAASKQALTAKASGSIVLMFDNDEPGRDAASRLAAELKLLDIRSVKIARIPIEGADLSDWTETFDDAADADGAVKTLIAGADPIKKKAARDQLKKTDDDYRRESDEIRLDDGSLLTLIWKPADAAAPHDAEQPGKLLFLHYDAPRTERAGFPVYDEIQEFKTGDDDDESIYAHHADKPAVLRPIESDEFNKRILVLPSGAAEHGSSEKLFDDLISFYDRYFVIQPEFLRAMAAYSMLTYRYRDARLETMPYLCVIGKPGHGKTRFGRSMLETCFRSVFVTAMRPVHLYRIVEQFKGGGVTMVFEELHVNDGGPDTRDFLEMLNAGNQRGVWVPRMAGERHQKLDWMQLFCPKVLGLDSHLTNQGLMRRCITAHLGLLPVPPEKSFDVLPPEFYTEAASLRCRQLGWRCSKLAWPTPKVDPKIRGAAIEMGIWQSYFPLVAMVPQGRPEAVQQIISLARNSQTTLSQVRDAEPEIQVLEAMVHVAEDRGSKSIVLLEKVLVYLVDQDRNARWDLSRVNAALRTLHLASRRTRHSDSGETRYVRLVDADARFDACVKTHRMELDAERLKRQQNAREIM